MSTPPTTDFQLLIQEQKRKSAGIDFPRAYRALIRGFIRAKRQPSDSEKDKRKL